MDDIDLQEWEYPEPDEAPDDESPTITCPSCGQAIYEDSVRCPHCGDYVIAGAGSPLAGRPWWFVIMALAAILAVMAWIIVW